MTRHPLLDRVTLTDLVDNDGAVLRAGDARDGERYAHVGFDDQDLTGITFRECEFQAVSFDGTKLRGATFAECVAAELHAPVLSAPFSRWHDVRVERSRLGSVEMYEAELRSVALDGCKLDFVNLRGASVTDVLLSNCLIGELDLGGATVQRMQLQDCRIGVLDVGGAKLKDVDLRSSDFEALHGIEGLRGATIDDGQLGLLAPLLAGHLGLVVE